MSNDKHNAAYHGKKSDYASTENLGAEQPDTPSEPGGEKGGELGPVGKVVVSVVALAILTPFIGILWAWALNVVRDMGGF